MSHPPTHPPTYTYTHRHTDTCISIYMTRLPQRRVAALVDVDDVKVVGAVDDPPQCLELVGVLLVWCVGVANCVIFFFP